MTSLVKMSGPSAQYHPKTPPINGAFPLDHDGECRPVVLKYLKCLKRNRMEQSPCRVLAKEFFACRMKHGLMAKDEWKLLGFGDLDEDDSSSNVSSNVAIPTDKENDTKT